MSGYNLFFGSKELPAPLTPEEEKELFLSFDSNAREEIVKRNLRLVGFIAKKFQNTEIEFEELLSIGSVGLIKAMNSFSIKKNTKFSTYASRCIENEILMYLRSTKKHSNNISLDTSISVDLDGKELILRDIISDSAKHFVDVNEDRNLISIIITYALNHLSYKEALVFLYVRGGKTQKEIAIALKISQSYVSRLYKKAQLKIIAFSKSSYTRLDEEKFTFSVLDDEFCNIGFSKKAFKNFKEILKDILLDKISDFDCLSSIQFNEDNHFYILTMLFTSDTFLVIAELIKHLTKKV